MQRLTAADRQWDAQREKDARKLVYALRSPLLLFRATDLLRQRTRTYNYAPGAIRQPIVDRLRRDNAQGLEILVCASKPDGLVTLPGVTKQGLDALRAADLEPCAIVEAEPGIYDAWVRLCLPAELEEDHLLVAARYVAAVVGMPAIRAHWHAGGHMPSLWSRPDMVPASPVARLVFTGKPYAPAGRKVLRQAERQLAREREAAAALGPAGIDPSAEADALARPSSDARAGELYRRYAEVQGCYSDTPAKLLLDHAVALAAFRAGASVDRVRQVLKAGADFGGPRSQTIDAVIDDVLRDPELIRWASVVRVRMEKLTQLMDVVRGAESRAAVMAKVMAG